MRKYIKSFLIALTVIILTPAVVVLAGYNSSISVQNTGAISYDMLACNVSANVAYWESDGFIGVNGTDIRIYRGTVEIPHMMVTDRITMSLPLPAYSSQTLQFVTGETPQDFYIVPGYSSNSSVGRVHIADNPNIELGNNFSINMTGIYLNTDNGTDKNIIYKEGAFRAYISENVTTNVSAYILNDVLSYASVTGTNWLNIDYTYDGNTGTTGYQETGVGAWSNYLTYVFSGMALIDNVRIFAYTTYENDAEIEYYDGSNWINFAGPGLTFVDAAWNIITPTTPVYASQLRARFRQGGDGAGIVRLYEFEINDSQIMPSTTVTGITTGEYDVTVSANTTHLILNIGGTSNSTALNGARVQDNANDIYLFENNSVAYCKTFEIQRIGVQQLYYAPNDIIDGTSGILPDRGSDATDNYGVILFGSNPANIALTLGAFASDYVVSTEISQQTSEVAPEVSINTITKEDAAKIADLSAKDPALYPLFNAINGVVGIPIMFMYQGVFLALAVGIVFVFGKFGHLTIGVVASLVVIGFATAWGVYDIVMLTILIISGIGLILMQGRQSV